MVPELGVNIDHVATVRQARRGDEPDPLWAAAAAQLGGADIITVHLREDRRHIQDRDVERLRDVVQIRINLEMAATTEMIDIARRLRPDMVTLVPEGRQEITTEGGLDVTPARTHLEGVVDRLKGAGIKTSVFIDPVVSQIEAAADCKFDVCEIHTGAWAEAFRESGRAPRTDAALLQLELIAAAGEHVMGAGMCFNAGHALTYVNVGPVAALGGLEELHIGHSIVARAVFCGMQRAVAEMKRLVDRAAMGATLTSDVTTLPGSGATP